MTDLGIAGVGDATLIASGGSALVYEAVGDSGERLAVKVLRGIRGAEVARRFEREQTAAERLLGHPNIMRIHHTGLTAAGEPYLVMPLIAGGSLHDELERTGAFPLAQAIADVSTAAEAIDFAHSRGVLHRDLKPANLLRADDGSVIVTDFGIARVVDAGITSATVGASTPLYAAPELLSDNAVSTQSDVYALGALLYTLLAGTPAFGGSDNIWATMHRIRTEVPAPIPGVPDPVMHTIQRAMAKHPGDRPASAGRFRHELQQAFQSRRLDTAHTTQPLPPDLIAPVPPALASPPDPPDLPDLHHLPDLPDLPHAPPAPPPLQRARDHGGARLLAAAAALTLVAGLAWLGTTRLLDAGSGADVAVVPPVDNSLPSPTRTPADPDADATPETGNPDQPVPTSDGGPATPDRLVSFSGEHFSAYFPEGWSLLDRDVDVGYGFRSRFLTDDMYLNVDTTPREQRLPGVDIGDSAREIAAGIASASDVVTEEVDGLVMHWFTFRNIQGIDSIDIFFEVDGDGYAVVAGSTTDPQAAFATARLVALSIRSNPE